MKSESVGDLSAFRFGVLVSYVLFFETLDTSTSQLKVDESFVWSDVIFCVVRCDILCGQLSKLDQAISDCSRALELDDGYIKAYLRRAKW